MSALRWRFVQFTAAMAIFGASSFQFYALAGGHARPRQAFSPD